MPTEGTEYDLLIRVLPKEKMQELCVRTGVERMFEKLLEDVLEVEQLRKLKWTMFHHLYRTDLMERMVDA